MRPEVERESRRRERRTMNTVIVSGKVVSRPERHNRTNGSDFTSFTIEVEQEKRAGFYDYPNVYADDRLARFAADRLKKGDAIIVRGRIRTRNYREPEGDSHKFTEIYATRIETADGKSRCFLE